MIAGFYEPTALGANQGLESGQDLLKDPRQGEPHLVYFLHIYTIDLDVSGKYIGWPIFLNSWAAKRNREVERQKAPMLVGEFGLNLTASGSTDYLREVMEILDKTSSGWAYWAYMENDKWTTFTEDKSVKDKTNILWRPYPTKVAEQPISYGLENDTNEFWLHFESDKNIKAPTEIYFPYNKYAKGWEIDVDQDDKYWQTNWIAEKRTLQLFTSNDENVVYRISIRSKSNGNVKKENKKKLQSVEKQNYCQRHELKGSQGKLIIINI